MLDSFDSRALRLTDCYGQRFMKAGTYRYHVLAAGADCLTTERPFAVTVAERKAKGDMTQHDVVIRAERGAFRAEPAETSIEIGDLVIWHCPDRAVPHMVIGEKEFFGSQRLVNESGYTHAFGSAGEYRWRDAYGSALGGVVRVRDPECKNEKDLKKWRDSLAQAALVLISEEKAKPPEVDIVTGQTVFFAVTVARGISVTDERVLGRPGHTGKH